MKSDRQFINTLQDNISQREALDRLISDMAKVEFFNVVNLIFCFLFNSCYPLQPSFRLFKTFNLLKVGQTLSLDWNLKSPLASLFISVLELVEHVIDNRKGAIRALLGNN